MGWSPGDQDKVETAKILLAQARDGMYKLTRLRQTLANIQHTEKRNALLAEVEKIYAVAEDGFKTIEMHLNR